MAHSDDEWKSQIKIEQDLKKLGVAIVHRLTLQLLNELFKDSKVKLASYSLIGKTI